MDSQRIKPFTDPARQYELWFANTDEREHRVEGKIKQLRTGLERSFDLNISIKELAEMDKNELFELALQRVNRLYDYPFSINS